MLLCDKSLVNEAVSYKFVLEHKAMEYRILAEDKPQSEIKWGIFVPVQ